MRLLLIAALAPFAFGADFAFSDAHSLLQQYCRNCHGGSARAGGFSLSQIETPESLFSAAATWNKVIGRVRNGEMPPKGQSAPAREQWEPFLAWAVPALRTASCQGGATPGPYPIRRLNRDEYAATIQAADGVR